jgi:hypothetical protein
MKHLFTKLIVLAIYVLAFSSITTIKLISQERNLSDDTSEVIWRVSKNTTTDIESGFRINQDGSKFYFVNFDKLECRKVSDGSLIKKYDSIDWHFDLSKDEKSIVGNREYANPIIMDLETGKIIKEFKTKDSFVTTSNSRVFFLGEDKVGAVYTKNNGKYTNTFIIVFDLQTGEEIKRFTLIKFNVLFGFKISKDKNLISFASTEDGLNNEHRSAVYILNAETLELKRYEAINKGVGILETAFSDDNSLFAVYTYYDLEIRRLPNWELVSKISYPEIKRAEGLFFSKDNNCILGSIGTSNNDFNKILRVNDLSLFYNYRASTYMNTLVGNEFIGVAGTVIAKFRDRWSTLSIKDNETNSILYNIENDKLTFTNEEVKEVIVQDVNGKSYLLPKAEGNSFLISMLTKGIYFARITTLTNKIINIKFMKDE